MYFYPRPPRGGRLDFAVQRFGEVQFLSTPSARRATQSSCLVSLALQFLSTPSARRATSSTGTTTPDSTISIHALREEGDVTGLMLDATQTLFLSTPSARRATKAVGAHVALHIGFLSTPSARRATKGFCVDSTLRSYFYPRPPRGGRQDGIYTAGYGEIISIHALREEGDPGRFPLSARA